MPAVSDSGVVLIFTFSEILILINYYNNIVTYNGILSPKNPKKRINLYTFAAYVSRCKYTHF